MRGNLFKSILNNILRESVGESILNPNDNTKNMFDYRCKNEVLSIFAFVDDEDFNKVSEIRPDLIHNKKFIRINIPLAELDDTNSEGYQKLADLCDIINGFGKYGSFTPEQVIDDASKCVQDRVTDTTRIEVKKSEDELFDELVSKFGEERVRELLKSLKLHTNIPLAGVDQRWGVNNIIRILSQDTKRVAAGKKPAVYVAKPSDWRMYNRDIKKDAMPFYLWYKVKDSDLPNWAFERGADDIYGSEKSRVLNGKTAKQKYNDLASGGSRTYGPANALNVAAQKAGSTKEGYDIAPYYDVDDTFVIPGLEDKFNDPERIGFTNNIKMTPTQASLSKAVNDKGETVQDQLRDALGGTDDKCAMDVYNALRRLFGKRYGQVPAPIGQDGKIDMNIIRSSIYNTIVSYLKNDDADMKKLYAKPETREAIAKVIACLYMGIHRIAPESLIDNFYSEIGQNGINDLQQAIENAHYKTRNIYNTMAKIIEDEVLRVKQIAPKDRQNNPRLKQIMEESISNSIGSLEDIKRAWGIEDHTLNNAPDNTQDDDINLTNEERMLAEAKFYSVLNKMNSAKF